MAREELTASQPASQESSSSRWDFLKQTAQIAGSVVEAVQSEDGHFYAGALAESPLGEATRQVGNGLRNIRETVFNTSHTSIRLLRHEARAARHQRWEKQRQAEKEAQQKTDFYLKTMDAALSGEPFPEPPPHLTRVLAPTEPVTIDHNAELAHGREAEEAREKREKEEKARQDKIDNLPGQHRLIFSLGRRNEVAKNLRGEEIGNWQPTQVSQEQFPTQDVQALLRTGAIGAESSLIDKKVTLRVFDVQDHSVKETSSGLHAAK